MIEIEIETVIGIEIGTEIEIGTAIEIGTEIGAEIETEIGTETGTEIGIGTEIEIGTVIEIEIGIGIEIMIGIEETHQFHSEMKKLEVLRLHLSCKCYNTKFSLVSESANIVYRFTNLCGNLYMNELKNSSEIGQSME